MKAFDVIKQENTERLNSSLIKGLKYLEDEYLRAMNGKLEIEIRYNESVKLSEKIDSAGVSAIALAQGIGTALNSILA